MWNPHLVLAGTLDALRAAEARARTEQAIRGLDGLAELELHPLLATGLARAGLGVLREQPYPAEWRRALRRSKRAQARRPLPADSQRARCDLVLLPAPGLTLADPLDTARSAAAAAQTLFAGCQDTTAAPAPTTIRPEDAFYLEVKCVGQFAYADGVPGPNRTYASELLRGLTADLRKLATDPAIEHGAALLVHFAAEPAVADHDLAVLISRCVDRGLVTRSPLQERFPIADRIGNALCTILLIESGTLARAVADPIRPPRRSKAAARPERPQRAARPRLSEPAP
ncbi:MAG: hypothetical protein ACT4PL_06890 [Phycisphaerales bacterium]